MHLNHTARWGYRFLGSAALLLIILGLATRNSSAARSFPDPPKPMLVGSRLPVRVRAILQRACQDCHSENTVWPWYANIPPIAKQIHGDVDRGVAFMNFSKWSDYSEADRRGYLLAIIAATQSHAMPPPKYSWMHPEAKLSAEDLSQLKEWALAERKSYTNNAASLTKSSQSLRTQGPTADSR